MTIKQLGGVFGRNPTFNDVTIEGQLTFDGDIDINSDLKVDGDIEATGSVTADSLVIGTSSIDASGNLLLNTTNSPTTTEAIISSDYSAAGTTNTGLTITGRSSGNWYNNGIHALGTALAFSTATTGTTGADATNERMRIDSVGHAIIPSGVTLGTATGVYNAAKTLDDYEEGAWTPTITGSTTAGTGTYTSQSGSYTKIGRQVTVYGRVGQSNNTGTGNIRIAGLPYGLSGDYAVGSIMAGNLSLTASNYPVIFMAGSGATYININQLPTGGGVDAVVPMDTSCDLVFSITYFV
jgi:hypothetical protein